VDFDRFSVTLLVLRDDAPRLDEAGARALQDAHLNHLATLHEAGHLLAAGPLEGAPDGFVGLSLLRVDPERARQLKEADPAVQAGRFRLEVFEWMVPAGAMSFARTRFPHSVADVVGA
jgi:uncharacterized protein YciI